MAGQRWTWLLYAVSLAALGLAIVVWERPLRASASRTVPRAASTRRRLELGVVAALLLVALAVRVAGLGGLPHGLWFDEAQNGLVGMGLVQADAVHSVFIGEATQMGALYFYVLGTVLDLLGNTIFGLRVLPALAGALTVPLVYVLASRLYGRRVAVASASLLLFSAWNLTFSRIGLASMATVALLDVAVYLCVVFGLRTGPAAEVGTRRAEPFSASRSTATTCRGSPCWCCSCSSAISPYATDARRGRFAVGWRCSRPPRLSPSCRSRCTRRRSRDEFNRRVSTASVFSQDDPVGAAAESLRAHLLMFNYRGDRNGRHNQPGSPMLDWITGALFLLRARDVRRARPPLAIFFHSRGSQPRCREAS